MEFYSYISNSIDYVRTRTELRNILIYEYYLIYNIIKQGDFGYIFCESVCDLCMKR